jgi:hypothetical protein
MGSTCGRRIGVALAASALAAGAGCGWPFRLREARHEARHEPIPLLVRNHGSFDVDVTVVRTGGGHGRRLVVVPAQTDVESTLHRSDLQAGGALVLCLHGVGSRYAWVTPAVPVGRGMTAYLDVYTDDAGNPSRSRVWTSQGPATTRAPMRGGSVVWDARLTTWTRR